MPLQLTTPINPGDLDSVTYGQVKIIEQRHRSTAGTITVVVAAGNTDEEGVWVPGVQKTSVFQIRDDDTLDPPGTEYTDLVTDSISQPDEPTYAAVKRGLYEWLIANDHYAGTIV